MKETSICICDENIEYLQLVQKYLLKRKLNNFSIYIFSDICKAIEKSKEMTFDICLINESYMDKNISDINSNGICILQETKEEITEYPSISKYQSMDKILEKVLENIPDSINLMDLAKENKLIVFFETQKNKEGLRGFNISKHFSRLGKKVLYLNLSPFTKFSFLTNNDGADVTDLIYYLLKDTPHISKKTEIMKKEKDGVSFFLPAFDYIDLLELNDNQWQHIVKNLQKLEDYDYVVIETNAANRGLMEVYENSFRFYINNDDDGRENFEALLQKKSSFGISKLEYYYGTDLEEWEGKIRQYGL